MDFRAVLYFRASIVFWDFSASSDASLPRGFIYYHALTNWPIRWFGSRRNIFAHRKRKKTCLHLTGNMEWTNKRFVCQSIALYFAVCH